MSWLTRLLHSETKGNSSSMAPAPLRAVTQSENALLVAVMLGDAARAEALLAAGGNPNTCDEEGKPVLVVALLGRDAPIVKLLLTHGADPNCRWNATPGLHIAVSSGHEPMVRFLLEAGAKVCARDRYGLTAMDLGENHPEISRVLREAGGRTSLGFGLGEATNLLKFPEGFDERYRKHLQFVERLRAAQAYPELRVYGLRGSYPEASVSHLIVITGALDESRRLGDVFQKPEAEQFVAAECNGNWDEVTAVSSVSNVADPGSGLAHLEEFNRLVGEMEAGAYQRERALE